MQAGAGLNILHDACDGEALKMASTAQKESIQAVAETGAVRNGDEEAPGGSQNAANFANGAGDVVEMLQGVVADDQVEGLSGEWQAVAIGAGARKRGGRRDIHIGADDVVRP